MLFSRKYPVQPKTAVRIAEVNSNSFSNRDRLGTIMAAPLDIPQDLWFRDTAYQTYSDAGSEDSRSPIWRSNLYLRSHPSPSPISSDCSRSVPWLSRSRTPRDM